MLKGRPTLWMAPLGWAMARWRAPATEMCLLPLLPPLRLLSPLLLLPLLPPLPQTAALASAWPGSPAYRVVKM